ncbi:MAG: alpha/beta hydrolase family protein [Bryobacteraceae bacterium]
MTRLRPFAAFSGLGSAAVELHRDWIAAREQKLARMGVDPVCPFSWGLEALEGVPGFEPESGCPELETFRTANRRWLENSKEFFTYQKPARFTLDGSHLQFRSPVRSLYRENDTVSAEYFRCAHAAGRAVLVLPHWNAAPGSYASFCRFLNLAGFSVLLVTLPYHGDRKPRECRRAEYSVSANIGRTIASARQGIIDTLCCLDWLEERGYRQFGIAGTSLGFGHAFVASALDPRLTVNVFNHCCSTVSDAIWVGMPRLRAAFESHVSQKELRECWSVINPISHFERFARLPKRSLLIRGRYDTTFAPDYVAELIQRFETAGLDYEVVELACGHYTIGDLPFALLSAYRIGEFLKKNLRCR